MIGRVVTACIASILALDVSMAADPAPPLASSNIQHGCEDSIIGVATVVPKLDCSFFKTTKDLKHTADCTSSHQGKHMMEFCSAVATKDGVELVISGGMPAYASDLTITINNKLEFKCFFSAVYPAPNVSVRWKVTKKALKLQSANLESRTRLRGWISVEFDEIDKITKETHAYKIEGFFKPVIQTPQEEDQSKEGEQADPAKAETKPADKAPAKEQSTPVTK